MENLKFVNDGVHYWFEDVFKKEFFLYMVIGGRGIGKTTSALYETTKFEDKAFVYIRRYNPEVAQSKCILEEILYMNGVKTKPIRRGFFSYHKDKKLIGYCVSLSIAESIKSFPFKTPSIIIFDEFTLLRGGGRYLVNEVQIFLDLLSTITRGRQTKTILIGNNVDISNPYFEYFNIPFFQHVYKDKDRGIYIEYARHNPSFIKKEEQTQLYALTKGTNFHQFHYTNELLSPISIPKKEKETNIFLACRFVFNSFTLNMYLEKKESIYFELRAKKIIDNRSFIIEMNGETNYFELNRLKSTNLLKMITKKYFEKQVFVSEDKASSFVSRLLSYYR